MLESKTLYGLIKIEKCSLKCLPLNIFLLHIITIFCYLFHVMKYIFSMNIGEKRFVFHYFYSTELITKKKKKHRGT